MLNWSRVSLSREGIGLENRLFYRNSFQVGEVVEGDRTGPEEVVEAHVQANKVCHIKQKG